MISFEIDSKAANNALGRVDGCNEDALMVMSLSVKNTNEFAVSIIAFFVWRMTFTIGFLRKS
jgi:hypothetical protein